MDEQQARLILQAYLAGAERDDPEVAEALREVAGKPELARWFAEEQAFDRAMAAHLEAVPAPLGLKTRILANATAPAQARQWSWAVKLAAVAALLFLAAQIVSLFRASAAASNRVPEYASEMVSFIRLAPPLEMKSHDLGCDQRLARAKRSGADGCSASPGGVAAGGLPDVVLPRPKGGADLLSTRRRSARASFCRRSSGDAKDQARRSARLSRHARLDECYLGGK